MRVKRDNLLVRNAVASYAGTVGTAIIWIGTLPYFVRALGPLAWGIAALVATMQAAIMALDAGIGQAIMRETALRAQRQSADPGAFANLFRACERKYLLAGSVAGGVLFVALRLGSLGFHWTGRELLTLNGSVGIAGIAAVMPLTLLYRSMLIATEKLVSLNAINVGIYIFRFGIGLVLVQRFPSIDVYLGWQLLTLIAEAVLRRAMLHPLLRTSEPSSMDNSWARGIPMYVLSVGMGAMAAQADKIVLGVMRPVAEFGTYFIAAQVATGVLQLIFPLTTAALPRVVHLRADGPALRGLNVRLLAAIVLCFAVGAVVLGAFGLQALRIWFAQADVPAIWTYVRVLLAGVACNALATVGYMNWLAHNRPGRILFANATTLIVVCTVTPILVWKFGGVGAAVGYMLAQAAATLISLDWVAAGPAFARFRKRIRGVNFGAAGSD